jgi:tetratricopeptide (TPR) repeat protein
VMTPSDQIYERLVTEIAKVQYESLTQILEHTAEISELNLVYILYKEGYRHGAVNMPPVLAPMLTPKTTKSYSTNVLLPPPSKPSYNYNLQYVNDQQANNLQSNSDETVIQARVESHDMQMINNRIKICEIYISQSNWKAALQDLREILVLDKDNSRCLALLGVVYENINQPQMAKISFKRSLQINPQEAIALKYILESGSSSPSQSSNRNNSKSDRKPILPTIKKSIAQPQKSSWLSHLLTWAFSKKS